MKVFYLQQQTAKRNNSFSPSATKPALAVESWQQLGLPVDIVAFAPATREQLYTVHDPNYVDGVLDLRRSNGFGNRLPEIAEALPYVAGSMVAATLHAYKTGETTFSPTSGAHHAGYDHGGGYCTFNFLALAAVEVHKAGAKKVGIIDCDMHYGDGTAEIIRTLGLHFVRHYSFGGDISCRETAEQWLARLPALVQGIAQEVDVIIYNAGADPHVDDPLGGVLTTVQLKQRDEIVFAASQMFNVPVAVSLAGGYQKDIREVLDVHDNTFKLACRYASEVAPEAGRPLNTEQKSPGTEALCAGDRESLIKARTTKSRDLSRPLSSLSGSTLTFSSRQLSSEQQQA